MYIVVGSVTTATRLARLLERNLGVPVSVSHTPAAIKNGGCSYSARIKGVSADRVRSVVSDYNFNIKSIYAEEFSDGERVYRDIS